MKSYTQGDMSDLGNSCLAKHIFLPEELEEVCAVPLLSQALKQLSEMQNQRNNLWVRTKLRAIPRHRPLQCLQGFPTPWELEKEKGGCSQRHDPGLCMYGVTLEAQL